MDSETLASTIKSLQRTVEKLAAESEVRKLHHKYGYYLDKCLYQEVVDLFSDRPDAYVQFLNGRFVGKDSISRLYVKRFAQRFVGGRNGPIEGWLLDHLLAQDIVDLEPGTNIAKFRGRTLMSAGTHNNMPAEYPGGHRQWWEGGIYENEYIKEDGVWKIFRLRYYPFWHGTFEAGWQHSNNFVPIFKEVYPENELGPDQLIPEEKLWPDTRVVPFHYAHPITGKEVADQDMTAPIWRESTSTTAKARRIDDWSV
ncbi:hypothetical protein G7Z17_g4584 [Cylindrodendrum hubeiense]|uniref:SnoaL-like domain-containing protein n=1 Tax=Cylindrodendrum hubeiense TaxID=595255 RepID=A0A9P5LI73_9HYPO|nr:hypothetical protein G7Z17_g4584 [Cylindrodendrum hubeiense]